MPFGKTKKLVHLKIFFRIVDSYCAADILVCNNLVLAVAPENGSIPSNKEFPMAYKTELERMLYKKARHGTCDEMEQMLSHYGGSPHLLEIMTKGAQEHIDATDPGNCSTWSPPSEDHQGAFLKMRAVEKFYLENDVRGVEKEKGSSLSDLFKLVSNIASRLETLESAVAKNSAATPPASKA